MNPINIRLCKGLWDNFDKCGHEADLTELSVMFACSWETASCIKGGQTEMWNLAGIYIWLTASNLKQKRNCTKKNPLNLKQNERGKPYKHKLTPLPSDQEVSHISESTDLTAWLVSPRKLSGRVIRTKPVCTGEGVGMRVSGCISLCSSLVVEVDPKD